MIVIARIKKLITDDGLMEVSDHIKIGQEFRVDTNCKEIMTFEHIETGEEHDKEMIQMYPHVLGGWLPMELIELLGAP